MNLAISSRLKTLKVFLFDFFLLLFGRKIIVFRVVTSRTSEDKGE